MFCYQHLNGKKHTAFSHRVVACGEKLKREVAHHRANAGIVVEHFETLERKLEQLEVG